MENLHVNQREKAVKDLEECTFEPNLNRTQKVNDCLQ
jgi:hypothetical protein